VPVYVSLLRGVNVSGRRPVGIEALKEAYCSLGLENPRAYVQSGNVVFEYPRLDTSALREKIQVGLKRAFGFDVLVIMRTKGDLQRLVDDTPFLGKDEGKLHVTFLSEKSAHFPTDEVGKAKRGEEEFYCSGMEIYLFCPHGYGNTKLSNNFFERKLKMPATTRNWRTVNALLDMAKT